MGMYAIFDPLVVDRLSIDVPERACLSRASHILLLKEVGMSESGCQVP
jgi:hypothetical protein